MKTLAAKLWVFTFVVVGAWGQSNSYTWNDQQPGGKHFILSAPATISADFGATLPGANALGALNNNGSGVWSWTPDLHLSGGTMAGSILWTNNSFSIGSSGTPLGALYVQNLPYQTMFTGNLGSYTSTGVYLDHHTTAGFSNLGTSIDSSAGANGTQNIGFTNDQVELTMVTGGVTYTPLHITHGLFQVIGNYVGYGNISPGTDNTYTLGDVSHRFSDIQATSATLTGNISVDGSVIIGTATGGGDLLINRQNTSFGYVARPNVTGAKDLGVAVLGGSNLDHFDVLASVTRLNGDTIPYSDNLFSLGSASFRWADFRSVAATIGTLIVSSCTGCGGGGSSPMTTLGDTAYEDATPTPVRLAGNTTTTRKFLRQTGTGSVSAAPVWDTLVAGDIPSLSATYLPLAGGTMAGSIAWTNSSFSIGDHTTPLGSIYVQNLPVQNMFFGNYGTYTSTAVYLDHHTTAGFSNLGTSIDSSTGGNGTENLSFTNNQVELTMVVSGTTYTPLHITSSLFQVIGNLATYGNFIPGADNTYTWGDSTHRPSGTFLKGLTIAGLASTDVSYVGSPFLTDNAFISATATTNASVGSFAATAGTGVDVSSGKTGSGTLLPIRFFINPNEMARFTTGGIFLVGQTSTDASLLAGAIVTADAYVSVTATTNASLGSFKAVSGNYVAFSSTHTGSGTTLPMTFFTGSSRRMSILDTGEVLVGLTSTSNAEKFQVSGGINTDYCYGCWGTTQNDVSGSRSGNTNYQNTSGRAMHVSVGMPVAGAGTLTSQCYSDTASTPTHVVSQGGGVGGLGGTIFPMTFVVLNNSYYRCTSNSNSVTYWIESY